MGDVVEHHQARSDRVAEIEHVEASGRLIEAVSVAASVEPEEAREQETNSGLMRDQQHVLPLVAYDDRPDRWKRTGHHGKP